MFIFNIWCLRHILGIPTSRCYSENIIFSVPYQPRSVGWSGVSGAQAGAMSGQRGASGLAGPTQFGRALPIDSPAVPQQSPRVKSGGCPKQDHVRRTRWDMTDSEDKKLGEVFLLLLSVYYRRRSRLLSSSPQSLLYLSITVN